MAADRQASAHVGGAGARPGAQWICLVLDKGNLLRWHPWLIIALRQRHDVVVALTTADDAVRMPAACRLAFQLERLIYRIPSGAAVDQVDSDAIAPPRTEFGAARAFDVVVDCAGRRGAAA